MPCGSTAWVCACSWDRPSTQHKAAACATCAAKMTHARGRDIMTRAHTAAPPCMKGTMEKCAPNFDFTTPNPHLAGALVIRDPVHLFHNLDCQCMHSLSRNYWPGRSYRERGSPICVGSSWFTGSRTFESRTQLLKSLMSHDRPHRVLPIQLAVTWRSLGG